MTTEPLSERGGPNTSGVTAAQFVRPHLREMAPYTPIEPFEVLSARYGRAPEDIVKLDANENPYGPPPEVAQALGSMPFAHVYPDPSSRALRARLARLNGVDERHLLVRRETMMVDSGTRVIVALRRGTLGSSKGVVPVASDPA